jgi:hypothetical protein
MPDLLVAPCEYQAAKYAVMHWHYSKRMPRCKMAQFGVWERGEFIGVILFGHGSVPQIGMPYGLDQMEVCELVRVALKDHETPVSSIVAQSLPLLRESSQGLRLVVSYADSEQGHLGTIYQAMNWIYLGMSIPADEYRVNGIRMHGRALRSTRSTHPARDLESDNIMEWARQVLDPRIERLSGSAKHRYVYPLDRAMRRQVTKLAQPYPRGLSVHGDTPSFHEGETGSTPVDRSNQDFTVEKPILESTGEPHDFSDEP